MDPDTQQPAGGDFRTKARQTLENLQSVLTAAGSSLEHVFSTYVYVRHMSDRPMVNDVFREYFPEGRFPNRVIVEVARLMDNHDIEIVCSAYIPEPEEVVQYLKTNKGQIPTGPFTQGIKIGQYVYCSGVRPIDPTTQKLVEGDFRQRVIQCFENLKAVLAEGGAGMDHVFTSIVYVRNMADRPIVNEVTREYFEQGKFPLRIIVEINRLNEDHDIEIECFAYLGEKEFLQTKKGQVPTGPFSQGVKIGNYVYCSGVRPIDPITQRLVVGGFEERVRRCLDNLGAIMEAGGADFADVYTTTVYLRNMTDLSVVDKVYAQYFKPKQYPIRHVVEINRLNEDHDIEIACSAYLK